MGETAKWTDETRHMMGKKNDQTREAFSTETTNTILPQPHTVWVLSHPQHVTPSHTQGSA